MTAAQCEEECIAAGAKLCAVRLAAATHTLRLV